MCVHVQMCVYTYMYVCGLLNICVSLNVLRLKNNLSVSPHLPCLRQSLLVVYHSMRQAGWSLNFWASLYFLLSSSMAALGLTLYLLSHCPNHVFILVVL